MRNFGHHPYTKLLIVFSAGLLVFNLRVKTADTVTSGPAVYLDGFIGFPGIQGQDPEIKPSSPVADRLAQNRKPGTVRILRNGQNDLTGFLHSRLRCAEPDFQFLKLSLRSGKLV